MSAGLKFNCVAEKPPPLYQRQRLTGPTRVNFELGMAEGVGFEPFLPSGDQGHKVGFATSLNGSS